MGAISQIDIPHQGLYTRNLLLMDEYSHKQYSKEFITVKPPEIGRSQGYEIVTAIGVTICFEKSAKGIEIE
ncbi:hypothetical protein [Peribacillus frigoritolerans]|uniref:hypothetical protein n=1 Tax=Peribacillus castrilensis TaxID=2897690 RepID=UPI00178C7870|nr:hypothetical protein [Peribacillus castrilensis]